MTVEGQVIDVLKHGLMQRERVQCFILIFLSFLTFNLIRLVDLDFNMFGITGKANNL